MHSKSTTNRVKWMLRQGYEQKTIAGRCGVSLSYVKSCQSGEQDDPSRWDRADKNAYLPDHEEILLKCAEIRNGWTDAERERRSLQSEKTSHYTVPIVKTNEADWGSVEESSLI